jgi:hypothetical protein
MANRFGGLKRWFSEKWVAQDQKSPCGSYTGKGQVKCRPSKKVNEDTPVTWKELSPSEKKRAISDKNKVGSKTSKVKFSRK